MILSIKSEQRKGNRFIMMTNDYSSLIQSQFTNADSGKRVRVWKDIRQELSLGYQDVKKRDKKNPFSTRAVARRTFESLQNDPNATTFEVMIAKRMLTDMEVIKGALGELVEANWLRREDLSPQTGGKTKTIYCINPEIKNSLASKS